MVDVGPLVPHGYPSFKGLLAAGHDRVVFLLNLTPASSQQRDGQGSFSVSTSRHPQSIQDGCRFGKRIQDRRRIRRLPDYAPTVRINSDDLDADQSSLLSLARACLERVDCVTRRSASVKARAETSQRAWLCQRRTRAVPLCAAARVRVRRLKSQSIQAARVNSKRSFICRMARSRTPPCYHQ